MDIVEAERLSHQVIDFSMLLVDIEEQLEQAERSESEFLYDAEYCNANGISMFRHLSGEPDVVKSEAFDVTKLPALKSRVIKLINGKIEQLKRMQADFEGLRRILTPELKKFYVKFWKLLISKVI